MGLRGDAAVVGIAEYAPERRFTGEAKFTLEQWADLAALALDDAGIAAAEVDGIVCANDIRESQMFVPATIAEYCGFEVNFAERVDLGGASAVGMVWRAAAAVELGICDVVVGALAARPVPAPPDAASRPIRAGCTARRRTSTGRRRRSSRSRTGTSRRTPATR